ncbi:hypothetical protein Pelo_15369 [Pelomyxa schiedti]|nr:hypothetical protein Pelo_15369 [Pelomyxa schiedti]
MDGYDFDRDPRWHTFLNRFEVSPSSSSATMDRLRTRFYKETVNPSYKEEPSPQNSVPHSSASSSSSRPETWDEVPRSQPRSRPQARGTSAISKLFGMEVWWMACHALVLVFSVVCVVSSRRLWFRMVLLAAACSYFLSLCSSLPKPILFSKAYFLGILPDLARSDNTHYLMYSLLFQAAPISKMAIFPLTVYSVLHMANLIHGIIQNRQSQSRTERLLYQIISSSGPLLQVVATYELCQFGTVALRSPLFLFPYYHFLKLRVKHSYHSKLTWEIWKQKFTQIWLQIRSFLGFGR